MQVSFNWLKDYVPIDLDPEEMADLLTMAGIEVENVVKIGDGLDGVVVGQITAVNPHPNADKLSLCNVDTGSDTCSIVCGATNIKPGDKVPLAQIGTKLHKEIRDLDRYQCNMRTVGTGHLVEIMDAYDLLPTENYRFGSFPKASKSICNNFHLAANSTFQVNFPSPFDISDQPLWLQPSCFLPATGHLS